jgi:hypothetical protein
MTPSTTSAATAPQPTPKERPGWFASIPNWAKAAVLAAGTGAAGYGLNEYLRDDPPAVQQAPVTGSLLQDLEDRGFHLPEASNGQ